MSAATGTIKITSEADAWKLLEQTLKEGIPDGLFEIVFDEWPVLEFKLQGEKFNSSLTVKVMEGFIDLQKNLNRTYAQIRYNKPSSRILTDVEREELEIVVRVDKGSSLFQVDLQGAAETIFKGAVAQMNGPEIVVAILGGALIWGGVTVAKAYFEHVRQKKQIDTTSFLSEQETKRMQIFADAMQKHQSLIPPYQRAEETFNKILKGASEADYFEIGGQVIPQDVVQGLVQQTRTRSEEVQLNGIYRIQKVDSSKPEGFLIGVRSEESGLTFTAKLEDKWVHRRDANLTLLQQAEWGKEPVYLRINGKELHGQISQAIILDVGTEK